MIRTIGFIQNFNRLFLEISEFLEANTNVNNWPELERVVAANNGVRYLNSNGYPRNIDGSEVTSTDAYYAVFNITFNNDDNDLLGWFFREKRNSDFVGIKLGYKSDLENLINEHSRFRIGKLSFDSWSQGIDFLTDLAESALPEDWKYRFHSTGTPNPILKSYIENIFEKLLNENNGLLFSDCKSFIVFNSNLLDKYFQEIYILCDSVERNGTYNFYNPRRIKSFEDLITIQFSVNGQIVSHKNQLPSHPIFFNDVNDVIFQSSWSIDSSFTRFDHIIGERIERFPQNMQNMTTAALGRLLNTSIEYGKAIAIRNYKFIVPMYRPQEDKIQLLMPIYLNGEFSQTPDFALVLDPDPAHRIYYPQTILPLDAAYQNARVIAKPDEYWLNPNLF
jgi:Domain of unknown function (DUF3825)